MVKFYICEICGNLIEMIEDSGIVPICCGADMKELIPGATDGAAEKHIPVFTESSDLTENTDVKFCTKVITVSVGSAPHPMDARHSIEWIAVLTDKGFYRKNLKSTSKAQIDFCLKKNEQILAIYSYCNLHGLWINKLC